MKDYDFSCWAIRYDRVSARDLRYMKNCLKHNDGKIVPLIWSHEHYNHTSVLGYATLEHREEGIYVYCKLNDTPFNDYVREMLSDRGRLSISPFVNGVKIDGINVLSGNIAEVSLVFARDVPDELYYPVMKTDELSI